MEHDKRYLVPDGVHQLIISKYCFINSLNSYTGFIFSTEMWGMITGTIGGCRQEKYMAYSYKQVYRH
jgi:hypothetical protein